MKPKSESIYFFFRKYKKNYLFVCITSLTVAFFESFSIAAMLPFFYFIFKSNSQTAGPGYFLHVLNKVLDILPFQDRLVSAIVLIIFSFLMKSIFKVFNEFLIAHTSGKVLYDTRKEIMEKYSNAPYRYFLDQKHGALMYYVSAAVPSLAKLLYRISHLFAELFKTVAILLFLFTVNIHIAIALILWAIGFVRLLGYLARKISYNIGKERVEASAVLHSLLSEFIAGIKHMRLYNAIGKWLTSYNRYSKKWCRLYVRDYVWTSTSAGMIEISSAIMLFGGVLFLHLHKATSIISYIPVVGIFAVSLLKILPSVQNMGKDRMAILGLLPDVEVIYGLLNTDIKEDDQGTKEFSHLTKMIEFKDVTFSYDKKKEILKNINSIFDKDKINAIVGVSGSGKTTIINLILGLHKPDSGSILIDGADLNQYNRTTWFNKVALVSQDPFIFHSTITDNIFFGQKYTIDEMKNVAKMANAHDFIMEMQRGYETIVGERGMKLSGGQQQRIAIARAMIRKPEVLILDEATSSLDNLSERAVQEAIINVSKLCTLIVIAHRLSTIRQADKIFVLKDGHIVGIGKHEELMANNGYYKRLYEHQAF